MKSITRFTAVIVFMFSALGLNFAMALANNVQKPQGTIQETVSADGITKMVVFENDLNQFAQEMIDGQLKGFIKSASVKIFDGFAEVTAITQKPFVMTLFVRVQIDAANNKLYPKILKMRYGFFPIPSFLVNFLIGKLVGQNSQNFQSTGVETPGIEWRLVDFKTGKATVEFKETSK
ncbi:MAG: hypothetical protein ABSE68_03360 [Minisyncoccia bacterium]